MKKEKIPVRQNIIRKTDEYILRMKIDKLPIETKKLEELLKDKGFHLCTYSESQDIIKKLELQQNLNYPAFTVASDQIKAVFYQDELPVSQRNLYIAHELGHIELEHIKYGIKQKNGNYAQEQENEADAFAYQLLAPACVLNHFNLRTVKKIENATLLSENYARAIAEKLYAIDDTYCQKQIIRMFEKRKMRKRILIIAIVSAFLVSFITGAIFFTAPGRNETVYITKTGTKYHKQDCHYLYDGDKMKDGVASIPLSECKDKGYTPCFYCFK